MMKKTFLIVVAIFSLVCNTTIADENYRGRTIASACLGCHGAGAAGGTAIPPIILGVPATYIETSMKAFRDGTRPSTIMQRIAKGYSDDDIAAVAQYFSVQGGK
jgi:sulfide dehydrogenase cytochrome subunit